MLPFTMQADVLAVVPWVFLAVFLIAAAVFVVLMFARRFGPAVEGQNRGNFQIIGIDSDRNIRLDITGAVIETPRFLNATNKVPAKMFLEDVTQQRLSTLRKDAQKNKDEIATCEGQLEDLKTFSADDMAKLCRVYVVRDGLEKHVLLQWHHVAESLENYACIKTRSKFSLSFGFVVQGQIQGWVKTEKTYEGNIPGFGRFSLHYFDPMFAREPCPDCGGKGKVPVPVDQASKEGELITLVTLTHQGSFWGKWIDCKQCRGTGRIEEKPVDPPSWLGAVILYVPTTVELHDELKSKDAQIVNLKRQLGVTGLDLSAAKSESDFYDNILTKFGVKDVDELGRKLKRLDLLDFALIGGPTVIFSLVAQSLNASPFYGMFAGLFAGAALVSIIKKR